jgi:signal transduction histidine kinase
MNERKHIKVLLVEDNPGDVRLIWEILSEVRNSPFYLNVADTLLKGLQEIEKSKPDVILLDLSLPDSSGIYTLNRVRDKAKDVPVVVITGLDDEVTAIKSLNEGAQDYLVKGRTDSDLLKRALIYAMERNRLIQEIGKNERKLRDTDILKSNFISMVFHELLIPASSIRSTIAACEKQGAGPGEQKKHIDNVRNNTSRLFALMDDLIDTREVESGRFSVEKKETDLAGLLDRNIGDISAIAAEKGVGVVNENSGKKVMASVDFHRMSQAITNLLLNAVKFSSEGGTVLSGVKKQGENVEIYVRDEGSGISAADKEKIFDVFFGNSAAVSEKHKRIGLGLLVVKSIVSAHGGSIRVESDGENRGATFYITIPKL